MKKVLSLTLALALACSLGAAAFADTTEDGVVGPADFAQLEPDKIHSGDVVYPGKTVYSGINFKVTFESGPDSADPDLDFWFPDYTWGQLITDKNIYSSKIKKDTGAKLIQSFSLVQKEFGGKRIPVMKFVLNDFTADDEQKVSGHVELKLKKDVILKDFLLEVSEQGDQLVLKDAKVNPDTRAVVAEGMDFSHLTPGWNIYPLDGSTEDKASLLLRKGATLEIPYEFWMNNLVEDADQLYSAGDGGKILKPIKNDDNEWEWEDENRTLVTVTFAGDDDQTKAYAKLNTAWDHAYYAEHFAEQDAFLYEFIAAPSLSSTSRATVELWFPFVDEDDDLTVDEGEWTIYSRDESGELTDVTAQWKLEENDNGEYVLVGKGRQLGTYIIAGPAGAARADEEAASETVPTGIVLSAYAR